MVNDQKQLNRILQLIYDNGFSNELVLMGSWNEYFYSQIYKEYETYMATMDLDFYCINRNKQKADKSLSSILIENGFVCSHDSLTNKTTFINNEFEIEFLHRITRELSSTVKVPRLDVVAECLGGMERYEKHVIKYHDDIYNYDVNIVSPAFYCAHKIAINSLRKPDKQQKDAIAINNVLKLIVCRKELKGEFRDVYNEFTKKERKLFNQNIEPLGISETINNILKEQ